MQTEKASPSVNLKRKIKINGQWRFASIARDKDKYIHDHVIIDSVPTKVQGGTYYAEWWENGKRRQKPVGSVWRQAQEAARIQRHVLALRAEGTELEDAPQITNAGRSLQDEADDYISRRSIRVDTVKKYRLELSRFLEFTRATHAGAVERNEILDFIHHLRTTQKLDSATIAHHVKVVLGFMKGLGAKIEMEASDWPKLPGKTPRTYQSESLRKLFAAAKQEDFELFQSFRMTGFREQEMGYCSWDDLNAERGTLSVTKKIELGFEPKNYEERTIPIPAELVKLLLARRKRYPDSYLIFATVKQWKKGKHPRGSMRETHMLERLKRLAKEAGLNCGRCKGTVKNQPATCAKEPICRQWGLHRFRHTYATTLLRDGADLVTVQYLLGHKGLESTKQYLHVAREEDIHEMLRSTRLNSLELA